MNGKCTSTRRKCSYRNFNARKFQSQKMQLPRQIEKERHFLQILRNSNLGQDSHKLEKEIRLLGILREKISKKKLLSTLPAPFDSDPIQVDYDESDDDLNFF